MEIIQMIFIKVLYASISSSFIIIILFLCKRIMGPRMSPWLHYGLWMLVVVRLLMPYVPNSSLSVFNLFTQKGVITLNGLYYGTATKMNHESRNKTFNAGLPSDSKDKSPKQLQSTLSMSPVKNESLLLRDKSSFTNEKDGGSISFFKVIACIWFIVLLSILLYILLFIYRFRKRICNLTPCEDEKIISILEECKNKLNIKKDIPIYIIKDFYSPFILGVIRPKICLPQNTIDVADCDQIGHVLLHELYHYKRKDLVLNILSTICTAIHWFNPIVWIGINKMNMDREIACDTSVLKTLGEKEAVQYGMTLIKLSKASKSSKTYKFNLKPITLYKDKKQLERRIMMISMFKKGSNKISVAAVALCFLVAPVTFTNAVTLQNPKPAVKNTNPEKFEFKIYDYTNINGKIGSSFIQDGSRGRQIINDFQMPIEDKSKNYKVKGSYGTIKTEDQKMKDLAGKIQQYVKIHHLESKISVEKQSKGVVITMTSNYFFDSGNAAISAKAKKNIDDIGLYLRSLNNYISIEGYTDNVPIKNSMYADNWDLSAARAKSVMKVFLNDLKFDPIKLSYIGYGQGRPVAPNNSEANRSKNRRVEIVVYRADYNKLIVGK